ncbi:MAG TPA: hypothetical protein VFB02_16335 [Bradyrhizobium sp.]|nr:hypothetical protein [Bradyrhizobium sp.]
MSTRSAIEASEFLRVRIVSLAARSRRLARIDYDSVGIRPQDLPYAPSPEHFRAANQRLAAIDAEVARRLAMLRQNAAKADPQRVLIDIALVEREIDRARRAFGMFFEVFGQRGTSFAPVLAAHDVIANDCYDAVREGAPGLLDRKALPPISYMEHGYSPATRRRGTVLARLLGETNPFPMIRIPWDRDNPWQTVFMHECAHNLHADMRIWQENRSAVAKRVRTATGDPLLTGIYSRWHKEIFADIAALLLAGPAAGWGMALFLTHPAPRALTYRHGGVHPTGFLRGLMLAEMMRRMGFAADGERLGRVWRTLYDTRRFHRMPERLLGSARRLVPIVVDEIAYQTRRNLAHRALADIIRFSAEDEQAIQTASRQLIAGAVPNVALPPRHLVSAASYALASGRVKPSDLSQRVVHRLASEHPPAPATLGAAEAALAA